MADQNLVQYVRDNLGKGYAPAQVKQFLIQQGYNPVAVDEALRQASATPPPLQPAGFPQRPPLMPQQTQNQSSGSSGFILKVLGILFLLMILLIGGCIAAGIFAAKTVSTAASPYIAAAQAAQAAQGMKTASTPSSPFGSSSSGSSSAARDGNANAAQNNPPKQIDHKKLIAALPKSLPGYTAGTPTGVKSSIEGFSLSSANINFTKGSQTIYVTISDLNGGALAPFVMMGFNIEEENANGYVRSTTYKSYKAREEVDRSTQKNSFKILTGDMVVVDITGDGVPIEDLKTAADQVDWGTLEAALK